MVILDSHPSSSHNGAYMLILNDIQALKNWRKQCYQTNQPVSFVPTMGALHEGHLTLIKEAKNQNPNGLVILSIFVNPTQFNDPKDFEFYPRTIDEDLKLAQSVGCDAVFIPSAKEIYPHFDGQSFHVQTQINLPNLAQVLCGQSRPGHFNGVCLVVSILFHLVQPDFAFFGEKDYQQLSIIRKMTQDLHLPIQIVGIPTLREDDGLAMSSRNVRLSPIQRQKASAIYQGLKQAQTLWLNGERQRKTLESACYQTIIQALGDIEYRFDYVELRSADDLKQIDCYSQDAVLAVAVWLADVRLIDNIILTHKNQ